MDSFSHRKQPQMNRPVAHQSRPVTQDRPVQPAPQANRVNSAQKRPAWWPFLIVGAVLLLLVGGWLAYSKFGSGGAIDGGKYQAVFLSNGQVYFGKLSSAANDYYRLTNIFYLQTNDANTSENPQNADSSGDVQLIKLGTEIHGPEDSMMINRDQVLFFENLKDDGKVTQSIKQYQEHN